jgi:VCBS repeat-containing protein
LFKCNGNNNYQPVDDAPVAVNDVNSTNEDTPVSGNASTNDTPSGDCANTWSLVGANGGALHGTVTMNANGTYTYTPAANYNGSDVFTYQLCDCDGDCSTATVTITVNPVDDVPVAVNDVNSTNEDTPVSGNASTNDTPSGDGGNVWSLVGANGGALHGTVTMNANGTYTYTPAANYNGSDVFNYKLCDADGDCSNATVTITINPVDDAPVAVNDVNSTNEDTPVSGNASTNDTPSGDCANTWSLVGANGGALHGTVTMNANGTYTYTPAANYNGSDVFTYQLCDCDGDCSTATVTITVNPVDDVPVAVNDVNSTNEDTPVSGNASTNDTPSGDGGNVWSLVGANGGALHGTVTMNANGTYTYTPTANYNGSDVFTYKLCDADGDCSNATVTITINPVDDAPVL